MSCGVLHDFCSGGGGEGVGGFQMPTPYAGARGTSAGQDKTG